MEKCGKFRKNGRFSGRIWPDWGNTAWADMAGLGSIGLRLRSCLMSKTSNFDFEIFDLTSTFPDSPTSFPVWCFPTWRSRQTLSLSRFETPKHNFFHNFGSP